MYDSSEKNGIIELCFIDRNCCSPKGRGTLTVKIGSRRTLTFTLSVYTDARNFRQNRVSLSRPRGGQPNGSVVKSHRDNESECPMSSCAYSKTEEHVIPKKTYRGDSASVASLCLSSFLRLSVSPLWHFTFDRVYEYKQREREPKNNLLIRNSSWWERKREREKKKYPKKFAAFYFHRDAMIFEYSDETVYPGDNRL